MLKQETMYDTTENNSLSGLSNSSDQLEAHHQQRISNKRRRSHSNSSILSNRTLTSSSSDELSRSSSPNLPQDSSDEIDIGKKS